MVSKGLHTFRQFFAAVLLIAAGHLHAQSLSLSSSADTISTEDELIIELRGELGNFSNYATMPDVPGLMVISHSESFNYSAASKSATVHQSYVMKPVAPGDYLIGPAWIQAGSRRVYSNSLHVHVSSGKNPMTTGTVMLRCEPSKKTVYAGEKITVAVRLYVEDGFYASGDYPIAESYSGFWTDKDAGYNFDDSYYDSGYDSTLYIKGKKFKRRTLLTENLYPNATGELLLPKYIYSCYLTRTDQDVYSYAPHVSFDLGSEQTMITVLPLPDHDSLPGFGGDVGRFTVSAELSDDSTRAWEPVTYTLWISGEGNFQLMMAPVLSLPQGLRAQNVYNSDTSVWNGSKRVDARMFRYRITPEREGDYDLTEVLYSYFDPSQEKYVSVPADSFRLHVEPGQKMESDTVNNLPDSFFTGTGKKNNAAMIIILCAVLIGLPVVGFIVVERRKKRKQLLEQEENARRAALEAVPEYIPPPDTSLDQARALIHGAGQYLQAGAVLQSVNNLYEALIIRICGLTKMRREEISVNTLRYQLRLAHLDENLINEIIVHYEDLKLKRYTIAPADTGAAHILIVRTANLIELSA